LTKAQQETIQRQLGIAEVAKLAGVSVGSIRRYRTRPGAMPAPDGFISDSPWWWRSSIETWLAVRPMPGHHRGRAGERDA